jgi:hypothetical protein
MGSRVAIFFSAATIAGAFSTYLIMYKLKHVRPVVSPIGGLLGAAIANMNGVGGKSGRSFTIIR